MAEMQAQWDVANGGGGSANANRRGSTKGYELSEIVVHSSGAEEVVKQLPVRDTTEIPMPRAARHLINHKHVRQRHGVCRCGDPKRDTSTPVTTEVGDL